MPADHKATSKTFLDLWGDNAVHEATTYLADNYVNHQVPDARGGTSDNSLAQWKELVAGFHEGFSDAKMEVLLQVAEGDYVCSRWRMTARHTGAFENRPPTGRTATWTGIQTDRYEDGKIAESWVDWDKFTWLEGIGAID
ncbi:ester cyclase [Maioricimonas sp. JC845]|uniref:ester cyclase n=1 Tax=Maioricimonas sp. JC845 TaxID=3232138 RepID=UPI00345A704E